jgi:organic radical activating enzyme
MRERRQSHLNGTRHADCQFCWTLEDRGITSERMTEWRPNPLHDTLDPVDPKIDIELSNICDLACRYCSSHQSSVWAEKKQDARYMKRYQDAEKKQQQYEKFKAWLITETPRLKSINISGGEALLDDRIFDLLASLPLDNHKVKIMTNLNTPVQRMDRVIDMVQRLLARNTSMSFRVSLDGTGAKNDWQRDGSSWNKMRENWVRLGSLPVQMCVASTVTPLTLESMCDAAEWIAANSGQLYQKPVWEKPGIVQWPPALDPSDWFWSFRSELARYRSLITDDRVRLWSDVLPILDSWSTIGRGPPSAESAGNFATFLDDQVSQYGGSDWRDLYPKVWRIVQESTQP